MKKLKKFKGGLKETSRSLPNRDLRIVRIDDGPLREKATADYKKAMAKLDKSCAEQRRFEQKDKPRFEQWLALKFGSLLTELRENDRLIQQKEDLIIEVEQEMFWSEHRNPRRAYADVMKARETPEPDEWTEPENKKSQDENPGKGDPFENYNPDASDAEIKKLFAEFLKSTFGFHPSDLSKADYVQGLDHFRAQFFNKQSESAGRSTPVTSAQKKGLARIKEIYRILVRRLHPDVKKGSDVTVSALWHEVQEAYKTRNLERLETLLSVTEMQAGKNANIRLSQMRGALAEINRTLRAVQQSLGLAKKDPAWGFSLSEDHNPLEKRIRREMESELAEQKWELAGLNETLDHWSRAPEKKPKKKPQKKEAIKKKPKDTLPKKSPLHQSPIQSEFFKF